MKRHSPRYCHALIAFFSLASWAAAAPTLDVHEVEQNPARYVGSELRLSGRFSTSNAGHLRLKGSGIDFHLSPDVRLPINPHFLEVIGKLGPHGAKWQFQVRSLSKTPSEYDRLVEERKLITSVNYPALFRLSERAGHLAKWYSDAPLERLADEMWRQALRWQEDELVALEQFEELHQLVQRARKYGIEESELRRIEHRALTLKAGRLLPGDISARLALAEQVRKLLPGSAAPYTLVPEKLTAYQKSPLDHYLNAPAATRAQYELALYVGLMHDALGLKSQQPGADFAQLASVAAKQIPEDEALARQLRQLNLERRAQSIERLSRGDALILLDNFRALGQSERASALTAIWLDRRRAALEDREVEDRNRLANDYFHLLDDRETAERLYRESLAIAPSPDATAGMQSLGYLNFNGSWSKPDQHPPVDPTQVGGVMPGDTEKSVLDRLQKPDHISRTVGSNWMLEQWRYEGPPRLWIYLERQTATGYATVTRVIAP